MKKDIDEEFVSNAAGKIQVAKQMDQDILEVDVGKMVWKSRLIEGSVERLGIRMLIISSRQSEKTQ